MPETLRLWAELSGIKVLRFRPCGSRFIVNDCYLVYQIAGNIHQEKLT